MKEFLEQESKHRHPIRWEVNPKTGCWVVRSHKQVTKGPNEGRVFLTREGKVWLVHRWVWTKLKGPIPSGMCICHHCDNPACINPDHLFMGTWNDNIQDMIQKGRAFHPWGEDHPKARLKLKDVLRIRRLYPGVDRRGLAKEYGIQPSTINQIVSRKTWKYT